MLRYVFRASARTSHLSCLADRFPAAQAPLPACPCLILSSSVAFILQNCARDRHTIKYFFFWFRFPLFFLIIDLFFTPHSIADQDLLNLDPDSARYNQIHASPNIQFGSTGIDFYEKLQVYKKMYDKNRRFLS
jgi:hypothetical protein